MDEINEWLEDKSMSLKIIDNKIDFDAYDEHAVR